MHMLEEPFNRASNTFFGPHPETLFKMIDGAGALTSRVVNFIDTSTCTEEGKITCAQELQAHMVEHSPFLLYLWSYVRVPLSSTSTHNLSKGTI